MSNRENRRLKRKVRTSYLISTISIALVLFLLGAVGYLVVSALDASDRLRENLTINVMMSSGAASEDVLRVEGLLSSQEEVREVVFIPRDEAARIFSAEIGEDFMEFLDDNPLPDSFEVRLTSAGSEPEAVADLERRIIEWGNVREVVYQRKVVEQIGHNITKFNIILLIFGGSLLIISIILLNNTIRVSIYSRRHIISTMKLVGATRGFILRPFVRNAFLQGLYAGIIACAMFVGMLYGLKEGLPEIRLLSDQTFILWIMGSMLILGIIISLLFTTFAVNKFVKMPTDAVNLF